MNENDYRKKLIQSLRGSGPVSNESLFRASLIKTIENIELGGGNGGSPGPNQNFVTDEEKDKLGAIQPEATKNDTDAALRDRSTHTGTQLAETISDLPVLLNDKVDKVEGKGLSDTNFTDEEKTKLSGLEGPHFKGSHPTLTALQTAIPTGVPGDYADVDGGEGLETYRCIWGETEQDWIPQLGTSTTLTGAQIKAEYEAQPDTNGLTDDGKLLLDTLAEGYVSSVNNQTGDVVLTAASVGALPDTYIPDYNTIENLPDFDELYAPKSGGGGSGGGRTLLYEQDFVQEDSIMYAELEFDSTQFHTIEVEAFDIRPSNTAYLNTELLMGGVWRVGGYKSAVYGSIGSNSYTTQTNQNRIMSSIQIPLQDGAWSANYRLPTNPRAVGKGYGYRSDESTLGRPKDMMFRAPQALGPIEGIRLFWRDGTINRTFRAGRIEIYGLS